MITKGDEDYFMVGDDDLDKEVKDYEPALFNDELRSLFGWTKQSQASITDNYTGGSVGGSMELSSSKDAVMLKDDSITAESGWNGAEYKHSFGRSVKDFSTVLKIHVNQRKRINTRNTIYL